MCYLLIGCEVINDVFCEYLEVLGFVGIIVVVVCDKFLVGIMVVVLEYNELVIIMLDGMICFGKDLEIGEMFDIVSVYQVVGYLDLEVCDWIVCNVCLGIGSCGGMFIYNIMQIFIGVVGFQFLYMVVLVFDDVCCLEEFLQQFVFYLVDMMVKGLKLCDIVKCDFLCNVVIVVMVIGGFINVVLYVLEIVCVVGYEYFWCDVMMLEEFNYLFCNVVLVLINVCFYGVYLMIDIDWVGGVQVIVQELFDVGFLNGDMMMCIGQILVEQVVSLNLLVFDGDVIYIVVVLFKLIGGLCMFGGNFFFDFLVIFKFVGVEGGLENNVFIGCVWVFEGEKGLIKVFDEVFDSFEDKDMIIV